MRFNWLEYLLIILVLFLVYVIPNVKADDAPDLIVSDISWNPSSPKTGDTVTFTMTCKNQGNLSAGASFYVCLYVDGSRLGYEYVGDLAAGASANATFIWSVGRDVIGGSHTVAAYVDMRDKDSTSYRYITESNENNNELSKTFQVTKLQPDLIVSDISWNPSSPKTGDTVTFTMTCKNQGNLSAGKSFYVCLYVDGSRLGYEYVGDLAAGLSTYATFTWTANRDISSTGFNIQAYVDMRDKDGTSYQYITESNENNNELSKIFQVTKLQPDLIILDISWEPTSPKTGDTVTFTMTYKNQGNLSAGNSFYVCMYVDGSQLGSKYVGDLAARASAYATFTWTANRDISSTGFNIQAYVDMRDKDNTRYQYITESNENNNFLSPSLPSPPLDLILDSDYLYVNLSWIPSTNDGGFEIINFIIYRSIKGSSFSFYKKILPVLFYVDTDITMGETYYYKISSINKLGEGVSSNTVSATLPGPPNSPNNLRAVANVNYIDLTWESSSSDKRYPITNYTIYRSSSSSSSRTLYKVLGNVNEFRDDDVINGIKYYYQVTAKNNLGSSEKSENIFAIPGKVPSSPPGIEIVYDQSGFIHINWDKPNDSGVPSFNEFQIYRGSSSDSLELLTTIGANVTEYFDYDIGVGNTYYYSVSAINDVGNSISSQITSADCSWIDFIIYSFQKWVWVIAFVAIIAVSIAGGRIAFIKIRKRNKINKRKEQEIIGMIRRITKK